MFLIVAGCFTTKAIAQQDTTSIQELLKEKDSQNWNSYNRCDMVSFRQYISDDVEFYHDKGGITRGAAALVASVENNLCKKPGFHLRRAVVTGSLAIYPLEQNGATYGAVVSGQHDFFITENGKPEFNSGRARFTHLWILKNGAWKMTRILSYDHREK